MVKISTKGRYAIRVMLDLAENNTGHYMPLMDIAQRQEISEKYLESIVSILSKNDFLEALRGKGGGYRLRKSPEEYTIGSILRITEGPLLLGGRSLMNEKIYKTNRRDSGAGSLDTRY